MRKMVYLGPLDSVEVPALGATAIQGEPIEVSDSAIADALARQGWAEHTDTEIEDGDE